MPKKRFPVQYTLVYFEQLKQWGQFTKYTFVKGNVRHYEVQLNNGYLIYPTLNDLKPVKDYYVVLGWCE